MIRKLMFFVLVGTLLVGCSGYKPGQVVLITNSTTVNEENFSPYKWWYDLNGGCTVKDTATIVEKGNYWPDWDVQLYLVETPTCKGWIPDSKLSAQ